MTDFVKEAKLTELENKIPDISNLGTKTALTTIENKIPDVSNLVNKTDYNKNFYKLQKLKIKLLTIIMTNILTLKSLIN